MLIYLVVSLAASVLGVFVLVPSKGSSVYGLRGPKKRLALGRFISETPLIKHYQKQRYVRMIRLKCLTQIPEMLDVMTLGLSSGLSFDAALDLYCVQYETELASELTQAMLSWRVGISNRAEALDQLAQKLDLSALRSFAHSVSEAINFGSPLASVLERQAESVREEQRSQIEEQVEKAPVKMLIPLGTLIVPAMLLAILGPLFASIASIN